MSAGDGREGKLRAGLSKARLGGNLAGKSLPRQIITIATWPLLEQVLSFICTSTSLFLATHLDTPPEETTAITAGIGVTGYVLWLGFLIQSGVGMGATALVSRMTGARKFGEANYYTNQSFSLGLISGLVAAVLMWCTTGPLVRHVLGLQAAAAAVAEEYMNIACWVAVFSGIIFAVNAALRGSGDTRTPFYVMLVMDGLNIVFSLIFTQVFGLGVPGLAWGLICGTVSAVLLLMGVLGRRSVQMHRLLNGQLLDAYAASRGEDYRPPLYLEAPSLRPCRAAIRRILSIGLPQSVEIGGIWVIQIIVLAVIADMGDAYVGAQNIAIRIESISFLPGFAIGMAGAALVGQYLGAGSVRMALQTIHRCTLYAVIFMGCMGLVFYFFAGFFVDIFASNAAAVHAVAEPVVRLFVVMEPVYAGMLLLKMCLRGAGDTRRVMWVSYGGMGFFRVVCLLMWAHLWPNTLTLHGIWLLFAVDMAAEYCVLRRLVNNLGWARRRV